MVLTLASGKQRRKQKAKLLLSILIFLRKHSKNIVEGYSTMFWEIEEQLSARNLPYPDLIIAPIGVGSFISAVVQFYKSTTHFHPKIFGVEPERAPCAFEGIKQDKIIALKGPYESVMAGLSCGKISTISFPA